MVVVFTTVALLHYITDYARLYQMRLERRRADEASRQSRRRSSTRQAG